MKPAAGSLKRLADTLPPTDLAELNPLPVELIRAYHVRSKHSLEAYAPGPDQPDWAAQPSAFRHYRGAPTVTLPLPALAFDRPFATLADAPQPAPFGLKSLGALLQLSFAISAWKSAGRQRWALRCNPSSGNLHPIEVYVVVTGLPDLPCGLYHYDALDHRLERRASFPPQDREPSLHVAFSSIPWREAWKYGERAFRYCQLDAGHAIGALAYAAAVLGWSPAPVRLSSARLARWLGLNRLEDFPAGSPTFIEAERPETILRLDLSTALRTADLEGMTTALEASLDSALWQGQASPVGLEGGYHWSVVDQVVEASAFSEASIFEDKSAGLPSLPLRSPHLAKNGIVEIILRRRSAEGFDPSASPLSRAAFYRILDGLLPRSTPPWPILPLIPRIHLALFVQRVQGLAPGIYLLPRRRGALELFPGGAGEPVADQDRLCPSHLDLRRLAQIELNDMQVLSRRLCCNQELCANAVFSVSMLGEFDGAISEEACGYRRLFHEAGLVGQALYLEAEAADLRGTGIGCYFDDPVHELLHLTDSRLQSMYHFGIGVPAADKRALSSPPYPGRRS